MEKRLKHLCLGSIFALIISGCGTYRPTVSILPLTQNPSLDAHCRRYAESVTPPVVTGQGIGGAAAGATVGSGIGGLGTGQWSGAGWGGFAGSIFGLLAGTAKESQEVAAAKDNVNAAYLACIQQQPASAPSQQYAPPPQQYAPPASSSC